MKQNGASEFGNNNAMDIAMIVNVTSPLCLTMHAEFRISCSLKRHSFMSAIEVQWECGVLTHDRSYLMSSSHPKIMRSTAMKWVALCVLILEENNFFRLIWERVCVLCIFAMHSLIFIQKFHIMIVREPCVCWTSKSWLSIKTRYIVWDSTA